MPSRISLKPPWLFDALPFVPSWLFEALQAIPRLLADGNQLGWPARFWLLVVAGLVNRRFHGRASPPHQTIGTSLDAECRRHPDHLAPF